jgi:S-(hydroxymethyl)glutathione dehydrogenase/alcohol dehydrogenase
LKAAVLYETNKPLVIEEIDIDEPGPGSVMVRTVSVGVCHGDHVVMSFIASCGACHYCQTGRPVLCIQGRRNPKHLRKGDQRINVFGNSAFAEYMVAPESAAVKVREDAPLDKLGIVGCAVATGVGAVLNTAKVEAGSSVAVIGVGGVGLSVIQGAVLAAADPIIGIDVLDGKLKMAEQFGATHFVNASKDDPVKAVCSLTGDGVDYAFEAIGDAQAIDQAFDMLNAAGEAIVLGVSPIGSKISIEARDLHSQKVLRGCLYGSIRPRVDIPRFVDLYMAGRLKLDELISRAYPLEGINEAFAAMKAGEVARSVITF